MQKARAFRNSPLFSPFPSFLAAFCTGELWHAMHDSREWMDVHVVPRLTEAAG